MTLFEMYTKEVTIDGKTYSLRPLSGRYLPKLYSVMTKFQATTDANSEDFIKQLDEETVAKLHEITFATFQKSYPKEDPVVVEEFVSRNLFKLLEAVIQVNIGEQEKE